MPLTTIPFSTRLRVVRTASINDVEETAWDSINGSRDVFHSHRFIRSVEAARVEESEFWYLLFFSGEELVATAVLSAFTVSLDLFVGGGTAKVIQRMRRWLPDFMKIRILMCGLPVSLGQRNLVIRDRRRMLEVDAVLVKEMSDICREHRIGYMCVKEFRESEVEFVRGLEAHGFFVANSIPYVSMKICWDSFEEYLARLRHGYRRPIKLALKKLRQTRLEIFRRDSVSENSDQPRLVLGGREVCPPEKFFELYMQVMERAAVKLETLNLSFFRNLYANMRGDWDVLALCKGNEVLGAALLTTADRAMIFALVGLDYSKRDKYDSYFNLVYGIIQLAIQRQYRELNLGQTSYWLKQRIGGVCESEYFYLKANHRLTHFCLRNMRALLFPKTKLQKLHVFREESVPANESARGARLAR